MNCATAFACSNWTSCYTCLPFACLHDDGQNKIPGYAEEFQEYASPYASQQSSFVEPGWLKRPFMKFKTNWVYPFIPWVPYIPINKTI